MGCVAKVSANERWVRNENKIFWKEVQLDHHKSGNQYSRSISFLA